MDTLREQLADEQHAIWAHWTRYQFSVCQRNEDGSITIPADKVERWSRQMETPYAELTEKERESDRHQADKVLRVLQPVLDAEAKLAIALGADKPDKPATPTERARYWALEAAAQKERAEKVEMALATFPITPLTRMLENAFGDDADAVRVWIRPVVAARKGIRNE